MECELVPAVCRRVAHASWTGVEGCLSQMEAPEGEGNDLQCPLYYRHDNTIVGLIQLNNFLYNLM